MPVRSLALRTDLMFVSWEGQVDERDDHVVRGYTPASPDYYFGNFLIFPDPPGPGDKARWSARFRDEFRHDPRIDHVCVRWDRPDGARGALGEFEADGFIIDHASVLTARAVRPPARPNRDVTLRPVRSDADWAAVERLQVSTSVASYGPFCEQWARDMVATYRRLAEAGRGGWFGAFAGDGPDAPLAADLGVFVQDGVGRFRSVETDPAFRQRGICGTLVHHAAEVAFARFGAESLVMVADPDYHAARIYESVGFAPTERLVAAYKRPVRGEPASPATPQ